LDLVRLVPDSDLITPSTVDDFAIVNAGRRNGTFNTVPHDGSTLAAAVETDGDGFFRDHLAGGRIANQWHKRTTRIARVSSRGPINQRRNGQRCIGRNFNLQQRSESDG